MPAHRRSLEITDRYRQHLTTIRRYGMVVATRNWRILDGADLDGTHAAWVAATAPPLTELQRVGVRLSHAYLAAFAVSETGQPPAVPAVNEGGVGLARDGRPLAEALVPSLFTIKTAIKDGTAVPEAIDQGLSRAVRSSSEETVAPARDALAESIRADGRIVGWRRVTSGGCGACLAAADGEVTADYEPLDTHPFCECSQEPVFADVSDEVSRPTGEEMFNGMSPERQDQALGPETAQLIRDGGAPFRDLIHRDPMVAVQDGITQAPLEALKQDA